MRIASFGSINVDIALRVDQMARPGETRFGEAVTIGLGGKGANQAVAATRLGGDVVLIGRVGSDAFAEDALARLSGLGVDTRHIVRAEEAATGVAVIQIDSSGQNAIVVIPGANAGVNPGDFERAITVAGMPDILLLQLETPVAASVAAAHLVKASGGMVIVDPAPPLAASDLAGLLRLADIALPNEHETAVLTGIAPAGKEDIRRAAMRLREMGVATPIIKLGARGAWLLLGEDLIEIAPRRIEPVDTVAAGDCFAGALAVALAEKRPLSDAARFAADSAALSVTRKGAAEAMPTRAELTEFLLANGSR